jgi:hypothetical protein
MKRTTQAIAVVCAALMLASCGKDEGEPISQKRADRLDSLLQQVQRQSDAGSCTTLLDTTIPALEKQADALPESVGSDTKETITDGVAHLRDLAETDCADKQQNDLTDTTESTTTSEPSTTTTTTQESTTTDTSPSTSTDTSPSTSTDTSPSTDTTPPDNPDTGNGGTPSPGAGGVGGVSPKPGNGNGHGNGNGGGNK